MKKLLSTYIILLSSLSLFAQNATIPSTTSTLNDHLIHAGKRVNYSLEIKDSTVNYNGKKAHGMAINGQIPGPVLRFTEGDTAYIRVTNHMKTETSLHWHGILIPNQYDGVPYITTVPIEPDSSHLFIFPLHQTGTYWYHSHSKLEEQSGLYGSIVIEPQIKTADYPEQVLLFSDWTNINPKEVLRLLKRGTDWFAINKGSVQSYGEAAQKGYFADKLKQEWMRMPAMDISDVKYASFLVNGTTGMDLSHFKPGETLRLRLIDGSSSTYFWLQFAGSKMTVVAADGLEVKPVVVDKLLMGIAETYDVLITIPQSGKYEFKATAQDVSGSVSAYFGSGKTINAPNIPKIPYFKMMHTMNQMMSGMNMTMGAVASKKVVNDGMTYSKHTGKNSMDMGGMKMRNRNMSGADSSSNGKNKSAKNKKDAGKNSIDMAGMKMGNRNMSGADSSSNGKNKSMKMDMGAMKMDGPHKAEMMNMSMGAMDKGDMNMSGMNMQDDGKGVKIEVDGSMMLSMGGAGKILTYDMLSAKNSTVIGDDHPVRTYQLYLTGNMARYTWSINNKVLSEADKILIRNSDKVRFVMHNTTMMEHPMHLHGHFFRVINEQGDSAPLKHTVSVEPMKTVTIEFLADAAHDWFFHCHVLYHMMSGMARVVRYEDTPSNPQVKQYQNPANPLITDDHQWFLWGQNAFNSQSTFGTWFYSTTRYELNADYRVSYDGRYEIEPRFQRYLDHRQFFAAYVGADFEDQTKGRNPAGIRNDNVGVLGLRYMLPLFLQSDVRISNKGRFRLMLAREDIAVSTRLRLGASYNTDNEYKIDTKYILRRNLAVSASFDNQYGFGGGFTLIY